MKQTADCSVPDSRDQDRIPVTAGDPSLDVPGMLAGRIGDLYASEERRRRKERTDRLMRRATPPTQE